MFDVSSLLERTNSKRIQKRTEGERDEEKRRDEDEGERKEMTYIYIYVYCGRIPIEKMSNRIEEMSNMIRENPDVMLGKLPPQQKEWINKFLQKKIESFTALGGNSYYKL